MKNIKKYNNIFTEKELELLNFKFNYSQISDKKDANIRVDSNLGRLLVATIEDLPESLLEKINKIAQEMYSIKIILCGITAVEYNSKYGKPNLPPHYDGDSNELIVNFQLLSNTSWDIGLDLKLYSLEDNSAILFNPNETVHWRPHKIFQNGEFVKMVFFRFARKGGVDYSNKQYHPDDNVFKEINQFRDNISPI